MLWESQVHPICALWKWQCYIVLRQATLEVADGFVARWDTRPQDPEDEESRYGHNEAYDTSNCDEMQACEEKSAYGSWSKRMLLPAWCWRRTTGREVVFAWRDELILIGRGSCGGE